MINNPLHSVVGESGFAPLTPRDRIWCSTYWATPHAVTSAFQLFTAWFCVYRSTQKIDMSSTSHIWWLTYQLLTGFHLCDHLFIAFQFDPLNLKVSFRCCLKLDGYTYILVSFFLSLFWPRLHIRQCTLSSFIHNALPLLCICGLEVSALADFYAI